MYWKTNEQWPTHLIECIVAYKCPDEEDDNWIFERALPSPKKGTWYSLEEPAKIVGDVEYWMEIDVPT